ncbi:hypothetical protein BDV96DRAFT_686380 [Lophiotrema nucula]|uniref:Uncharacterized protein n=1 Tax=Lophiotrema nucula TaxID=690887 RepID=A0A6A5ZEJ5_9PLEO|nr:hypothetical protein BDV96DRAFT_686380 [Lophiotrema nucula]
MMLPIIVRWPLPVKRFVIRSLSTGHQGPSPEVTSGKLRDAFANATKGLSNHVQTIRAQQLEPAKEPVRMDIQARVAASASVPVSDDKPTLYIPGSPPRLTTSKVPFRLLNEPVGRRRKSFLLDNTLYPALRAMNPRYDLSKIDVVCSTWFFTRLFWFVSLGRQKTVQRIRIQLIKNTIVLSELALSEFIGKEGKSVESLHRLFSTPEDNIPSDARYFRFLECKIGGLAFIIRAKVDAWNPDLGHSLATTSVDAAHTDPEGTRDEDLKNHDTKKSTEPDEWTIVQAGSPVPISASINWRFRHYGDNPQQRYNRYLQSWLSQTFSNFSGVLAFENQHLRQSSLKNYETFMQTWIKDHEDELRKTCALLEMLRDAAQRSRHGILIASIGNPYAKKEDQTIELYEPEFDADILDEEKVPEFLRVKKDMLSESTIQQFWYDNARAQGTSTTSEASL